jgi:hypothetical protein
MKPHNIKTLISSIILEAVISYGGNSTTKAHTKELTRKCPLDLYQ